LFALTYLTEELRINLMAFLGVLSLVWNSVPCISSSRLLALNQLILPNKGFRHQTESLQVVATCRIHTTPCVMTLFQPVHAVIARNVFAVKHLNIEILNASHSSNRHNVFTRPVNLLIGSLFVFATIIYEL